MKDRREARRIALDVLYEAEIRDWLPVKAWDAYEAEDREAPRSDDDPAQGDSAVSVSPDAMTYARSLVEGIQTHQAQIDSLIVRYADNWTIDRMPIIDRTLLRIALFEILWGEDVPVAVAINEAVELAKSLSTEGSGRFVNGLLGRIVEEDEVIQGRS